MTQLELVRLTPTAWREYREIRLAALAEAPFAFGSTLAEERRLRAADWRARLAGGRSLLFGTEEKRSALSAGWWMTAPKRYPTRMAFQLMEP